MEFQGKPVIITKHAAERARLRYIAYPDQIYEIIQTGKLKRFGKHFLKFEKRGKHGCTICICEEVSDVIIVKTVERGT
ncbi:MAG: hypothetical protein V1722_05215 [Candidatus Micrarchaeota archaeon]